MKVRIRHVPSLVIVAAVLALVPIVLFAPGEAMRQEPSSTGATNAPLRNWAVAYPFPGNVAIPRKSGEQYELPLRYLVKSEDGRPEVAALLYTGYSFEPELLRLELSSTAATGLLPRHPPQITR